LVVEAFIQDGAAADVLAVVEAFCIKISSEQSGAVTHRTAIRSSVKRRGRFNFCSSSLFLAP
jgi:hypothetical protein